MTPWAFFCFSCFSCCCCCCCRCRCRCRCCYYRCYYLYRYYLPLLLLLAAPDKSFPPFSSSPSFYIVPKWISLRFPPVFLPLYSPLFSTRVSPPKSLLLSHSSTGQRRSSSYWCQCRLWRFLDLESVSLVSLSLSLSYCGYYGLGAGPFMLNICHIHSPLPLYLQWLELIRVRLGIRARRSTRSYTSLSLDSSPLSPSML